MTRHKLNEDDDEENEIALVLNEGPQFNNFEDVLKVIGPFGKWQLWICIVLAFGGEFFCRIRRRCVAVRMSASQEWSHASTCFFTPLSDSAIRIIAASTCPNRTGPARSGANFPFLSRRVRARPRSGRRFIRACTLSTTTSRMRACRFKRRSASVNVDSTHRERRRSSLRRATAGSLTRARRSTAAAFKRRCRVFLKQTSTRRNRRILSRSLSWFAIASTFCRLARPSTCSASPVALSSPEAFRIGLCFVL